MFGFQQCCDADLYTDLGKLCSINWESCWHKNRPVGSVILNALMPYGLAPISHLLLLFFPLYLIASESGFELGRKYSKYWVSVVMLRATGAFLLLEIMFIGLASVNLTDVSAGILAALAILGFTKKNAYLLALAGGLSVLIRSAYLYPFLILVIWFLIECLYEKRREGLYVGLFFVCIAPQYLLTYQHTGMFAFLEPSSMKYWQDFHFSTSWYGFDTLLPHTSGAWQSSSLLDLTTAYRQQQWGEMLHLFAARMGFYFSSFVPWSKVYLTATSDRIFSPLILIWHLAMVALSILYLMRKGVAWRMWLPLSLILAQSLLIVPEQRFIFVIQLFLVMFSYLYFFKKGRTESHAT